MDAEVAIVGCGPAGGIAAKVLSEKGFSVLAIDRKKKIGYPIQCGEAISAAGLKNNGIKISSEWLKKKHKGGKIFVPNGKFFLSLVNFLSIDRAKFDQSLIKEAVDNGCKLFLRTNVSKVKKKNEIWLVRTNRGILKSKILIGADGSESNVAKQIGVLKHKEVIRAIQYKFRDLDFLDDGFLYMYLNEKFKNGYAWVFPRGDEFNVGVGGIGNIKLWLDKFCKKMGFKMEKRKSVGGGLLPKKIILESFEKSSALIVGDAAGLTNPLFGGGIHAALFSGRLAAETICKSLELGDLSRLKEYDRKIKNSSFTSPLLHKVSEIFYSLKNEEYNFIGEVFNGKNWKNVSYFNIFKKFLIKPKFFLKLIDFWTLKRGIELSERLV